MSTPGAIENEEGRMSKPSQLDTAIADLQAQRKVLSLAIAHLEQQKEKEQAKRSPRTPTLVTPKGA
jgi:hypothetical protein